MKQSLKRFNGTRTPINTSRARRTLHTSPQETPSRVNSLPTLPHGILTGLAVASISLASTYNDQTTIRPSCEESEKMTKVEEEEDPYENLPEEDEPTHCEICLINRQGPCRPLWRKFERCMKDHPPRTDEEDEGDDSHTEKGGSLEEDCSRYMMPWIECQRQFRNTYTLIYNKSIQDVYDGIEEELEESNIVHLDQKDFSSILQIGPSWWEEEDREKDDNGVCLVDGTARINLVDEGSGHVIAVAYIKDQDGTLLGQDKFHSYKKDLQEKEGEKPKVGFCYFNVNPETTKGIQVFALYQGQETVTGASTKETDEEKSAVVENIKRTLYKSSVISMEDMVRPILSTETTSPKENVTT